MKKSWTKEECLKIALTFKSITKFKKLYLNCYNFCKKQGFLESM